MPFTYIFIIIILIIIYAQFTFQLKKGDNLDIYEIDYLSNKELNESASLKQPLTLHFSHLDSILKHQLNSIQDSFSGFEIYLKETSHYTSATSPSTFPITPPAFLPLKAVATTFQTDTEHRYFTSNNSQFIQETGLIKSFQPLDHLFQPPLSTYSNYDIITGSNLATTPLLYHTWERRFLYVTSGSIQIKLTPWRSTKYAIMYKNNYTREYGSPLNVWKPQPDYQSGYDKMRFIDCRIHEGSIIYIPPFWLYSIQFNQPNTIIASFDYASPMNLGTNIHNFANHYYDVFYQSKQTIIQDQKQQEQAESILDQEQNLSNENPIHPIETTTTTTTTTTKEPIKITELNII
jgi:hypothetical protein